MSMSIKEFIEKAIEGGRYKDYGEVPTNGSEILLDPKAWEAVGKVEGWEDETYDINMPANNKRGAYKIKMKRRKSKSEPAWKKKQLNFVKHLQQGLSIEEALAQINN